MEPGKEENRGSLVNRTLEDRTLHKPERLPALKAALRLNVGHVTSVESCILVNKVLKPIELCTSKVIREALAPAKSIKEFKVGLILTEAESATWGLRLAKLTSIKHGTVLEVRFETGSNLYGQQKSRLGRTDDRECQLESPPNFFCDYYCNFY